MNWDYFGTSFRKKKNEILKILIEGKFRHGTGWKEKKYKKRLFYYFRSYYLKGRHKELGVIWASLFFLVGFILLGFYGLSVYC